MKPCTGPDTVPPVIGLLQEILVSGLAHPYVCQFILRWVTTPTQTVFQVKCTGAREFTLGREYWFQNLLVKQFPKVPMITDNPLECSFRAKIPRCFPLSTALARLDLVRTAKNRPNARQNREDAYLPIEHRTVSLGHSVMCPDTGGLGSLVTSGRRPLCDDMP
jgi:hypothetical protein